MKIKARCIKINTDDFVKSTAEFLVEGYYCSTLIVAPKVEIDKFELNTTYLINIEKYVPNEV